MVDGAAKLMDVEAVAEVSEDTLVVETEEVAATRLKQWKWRLRRMNWAHWKSTEQAVAVVQDTAVSDLMLPPTRDSTLDFESVPASKKSSPVPVIPLAHSAGEYCQTLVRWIAGGVAESDTAQ